MGAGKAFAVLLGCSCSLFVPGVRAQETGATQHEQKAQQYLRSRQPELARKEFEAVVAADPSNLDAQANLGVLLYFGGKPEEAEPHLRAALALDPKLGKVQALLGLCEHRTGHLSQARVDLTAALPTIRDPKVLKQAGLELVELDTAAGDLPAAAAAAERLKQAAPADPEILYAVYRVYTDLAGEAILDLSLAAPKSGQMQQAIAHELERIRDYSGAVASFRKAIALDSTLPGIHFELAEALHASDSQSDRGAAEAEYAIALQQDPGQAQAAVRLGDLHADRNDMAGAEKFYGEALAAQPSNAEALIGMAHVDSERNQNDKAAELLQGVIAADPTNMLAHYRLSALYRKLHRPDDARRELAEYQRIKDLKENLRQVYSSMRLSPPGPAEPDKASGTDGKSGVQH